MNGEFIAPFISSISEVFNTIENTSPKIGSLISKNETILSNGISIIVGMIGEVRGQVIFTFDEETAKAMTSVMMMGMPIDVFDELAMSAISELANMIVGNATTIITQRGLDVDISTPMLIMGMNIRILNNLQATVIPVETESGFLEVNVCIE